MGGLYEADNRMTYAPKVIIFFVLIIIIGKSSRANSSPMNYWFVYHLHYYSISKLF